MEPTERYTATMPNGLHADDGRSERMIALNRTYGKWKRVTGLD